MSAAPGLFRPPPPENEPVKSYAPGTREREELRLRLQQMQSEQIEAPMVIGGEEVRTGDTFESVMPHDKDHVLATVHKGDARHVEQAIKAAGEAWEDWHRTPWEERAAVFLRAAELLAGPWRSTLNAATMLGQSKTAHQAEIDAACELTDFFRFNVQFMLRIYAEQPSSAPGTWNRMEYRPLEGFVFAVTPFNFTAIGGNLPGSAALMGNTVVWKPASTAAYSAHFLMKLFEAAGLPPGVINLVYGSGAEIGDPALASPRPGRRPLHRFDTRVSVDVEDHRLEHRELPQLSAHRRRDRWKGLHRRAPVRRRRGGRDGDRARQLRVPGSKVLRRVAGVRSLESLARDQGASRRTGQLDQDGRRLRLPELHGRGDRRRLVQDAAGRNRGGEGGGQGRSPRRRRL